MDWELLLVSILVLAAFAYVGHSTWKSWFGKKSTGCGGGCGCAESANQSAHGKATETFIPLEHFKLRKPQ